VDFAAQNRKTAMQVFHIHYRNTQGTLMRILNALSRRGIDMPYVQAEPLEHTHRVTLLLDVNARQAGQLSRDWHAVVDVVDVRAGAPIKDLAEQSTTWTAAPHPPASAVIAREAASGALA
jgi:acetolactate synthase small subunit